MRLTARRIHVRAPGRAGRHGRRWQGRHGQRHHHPVHAAAARGTFEDVHFDFDRYTLRPEATRYLDEAIKALQEDPNLRITVEGHTCNIGTTEYNLALGCGAGGGAASRPWRRADRLEPSATEGVESTQQPRNAA
jgi:hypothetical protein